MSIGGNIRNAREIKKISRQEFANKLGVTDVTISRYENNIRTPNIETLNKMSQLLEISIDELINGTLNVDNIAVLNKLIKVSNEKSDGHFTLMKFTGNWRCCLGTIQGDCRSEIVQMAEGKTIAEAINNAIKYNVNSINFNRNVRQVYDTMIFI